MKISNVCLFWFSTAAGVMAADPATWSFPLTASDNGRYFVDQKGQPFFFHADTAWQLPKRLARGDIDFYLDDRKRKGFTAILIQSFSKEVTPLPNVAGEIPFDQEENILKPNEKYWKEVDYCVEAAAKRDLIVAMAPLWIRWGRDDKQGWRNHLTEENAQPYGEFLGKRYAKFTNLLWILGGDADPGEKTEAIRRIARGIKRHAPAHLITVHNGHKPSARFFSQDDWLGVNMAYTYEEVYPQILGEWKRPGKPRPILLGESGYEEESNDKRGGDPFRMRRQFYAAVLSGALGGHAFGQKHVWRFADQWKQALDSPATKHMVHAGKFFQSIPWWQLSPDLNNELVVEGRGSIGEVTYVTAAVSADGRVAVAYIPEASRKITINLARLKGPVTATWHDPTSGTSRKATGSPFPAEGRKEFTPPGKNSADEGDWVLLLQNN